MSSERIWTDTNNQSKMRNRDLPMFPVVNVLESTDESGSPKYTQQTVGGFTKFEQAVFMIAQGFAQREGMNINNIPQLSEEIATKIFDQLDKDK